MQQVFRVKRGDLRDLSFIAWAIFAFVAIISAYASYQPREQRDFVYFYAIGQLLNENPPSRLYDFDLQKKLIESLQPIPPTEGHWGAFAYPPQTAMMFQPFALLPQWTAFRIWAVLSLAAYLTGLWVLTRRFCGPDLLERSLFFWFGLSFWPFINWMLLAGQLSGIGFLAMSLALYWEDRERFALSGLALAICTYKPTLLVLILPMLVIMKRARTLAWFAGCAAAIASAATIAGGPGIWPAYLATTRRYAAGVAGVKPPTMDLRSLGAAIPHGGWALLVLGLIAGAYLVWLWTRARTAGRTYTTLTWATTLTWTLLLNLYIPIYDSVQVVVSAIATAAVLMRFAPRLFVTLCGLLLVAGFVSTWLSGHLGWQILTPVVAAVGILQIRTCEAIARGAIKQDPAPM
jgi:hypothetical protein